MAVENVESFVIMPKFKPKNFSHGFGSKFSTYSLLKSTNVSSIPSTNLIIELEDEKVSHNSIKKCVIICDDCKMIRQSQRKLLMTLLPIDEFEIYECNDGIDLVKKAVDLNFLGVDILLILTDENMELMNGSEAVEILNNLIYKSKIKPMPICSVTAFEDKETKNKIFSKGVRKIFSKPLSREELEKYLKDLKII
jgi:CheY-like chemotaxis protein